MAQRYWLACYNMGFVGTDKEQEIDLYDYIPYKDDEKEMQAQLEAMSDDKAESIVANIAYELALENIDSYARKVE